MPNGSSSGEKLNYGEWGELYVLLRLLGDGRLSLTDESEHEIDGYHMDVVEVLRRETEGRLVRYKVKGRQHRVVDVVVNDGEPRKVASADFSDKADELLSFVRGRHSAPFTVPDELGFFFDRIEVEHYKAKGQDKSDIFLTVSDPRTGLVRPDVGYSIKTKWSKKSTLFNTARASATVYQLTGPMTDGLAEEVNAVRDARGHADVIGRCARVREEGCGFEFQGYAMAQRAGCRAMEENLDLINPHLVTVWRRVVEAHFLERLHPNGTSVAKIGEWLVETNPCGITRPEAKYPYMLKSFLYASYCGMTASTLWDGESRVNGGLITVGQDGKVLAFNALEGDVFKSYLYHHCNIDYPDTSVSHGDYGKVYKQDGHFFFNLNFQVRFDTGEIR